MKIWHETYKGWKIIRNTNFQHPEMIIAEQYGATLRANNITTLKAVIDNHIADRFAIHEQWNTERKSS